MRRPRVVEKTPSHPPVGEALLELPQRALRVFKFCFHMTFRPCPHPARVHMFITFVPTSPFRRGRQRAITPADRPGPPHLPPRPNARITQHTNHLYSPPPPPRRRTPVGRPVAALRRLLDDDAALDAHRPARPRSRGPAPTRRAAAPPRGTAPPRCRPSTTRTRRRRPRSGSRRRRRRRRRAALAPPPPPTRTDGQPIRTGRVQAAHDVDLEDVRAVERPRARQRSTNARCSARASSFLNSATCGAASDASVRGSSPS